jgi:hypothetical protein
VAHRLQLLTQLTLSQVPGRGGTDEDHGKIDADSGRGFGGVGLHADLQVMFGDCTLAERWSPSIPIGFSRKPKGCFQDEGIKSRAFAFKIAGTFLRQLAYSPT